jgi:hypothetical protein
MYHVGTECFCFPATLQRNENCDDVSGVLNRTNISSVTACILFFCE